MSSAAEKYIGRQKSLCTIQGVFKRNHHDLVGILSLVSSPEYVLKKLSEGTSDTEIDLHIDLTRHLHNYLMSAASLIAHTRHMMTSAYKDLDIHKSYQSIIDSEFVPCNMSGFIKEMRNYIAHNGTFPGRFHRQISDEITCKYTLDTEKLKCWSGWNCGSKEFLKIQDTEINLLPLIHSYSKKVFEFVLWLNTELAIYHENDMAEFRKLRAY